MTNLDKVIFLLEQALTHAALNGVTAAQIQIQDALALLREKPDPAELSKPAIDHCASMDIYSPPGTRIVFAYPDAGYPGQQKLINAILKVGNTYTVERTEVGQTSTRVYLKEVAKIPPATFNSVFFAPVTHEKEQ